jgi:hypothetical protein
MEFDAFEDAFEGLENANGAPSVPPLPPLIPSALEEEDEEESGRDSEGTEDGGAAEGAAALTSIDSPRGAEEGAKVLAKVVEDSFSPGFPSERVGSLMEFLGEQQGESPEKDFEGQFTHEAAAGGDVQDEFGEISGEQQGSSVLLGRVPVESSEEGNFGDFANQVQEAAEFVDIGGGDSSQGPPDQIGVRESYEEDLAEDKQREENVPSVSASQADEQSQEFVDVEEVAEDQAAINTSPDNDEDDFGDFSEFAPAQTELQWPSSSLTSQAEELNLVSDNAGGSSPVGSGLGDKKSGTVATSPEVNDWGDDNDDDDFGDFEAASPTLEISPAKHDNFSPMWLGNSDHGDGGAHPSGASNNDDAEDDWGAEFSSVPPPQPTAPLDIDAVYAKAQAAFATFSVPDAAVTTEGPPSARVMGDSADGRKRLAVPSWNPLQLLNTWAVKVILHRIVPVDDAPKEEAEVREEETHVWSPPVTLCPTKSIERSESSANAVTATPAVAASIGHTTSPTPVVSSSPRRKGSNSPLREEPPLSAAPIVHNEDWSFLSTLPLEGASAKALSGSTAAKDGSKASHTMGQSEDIFGALQDDLTFMLGGDVAK